ncbi:MAG: M48 family metalloprotease [Pseudomonadota bacterium]
MQRKTHGRFLAGLAAFLAVALCGTVAAAQGIVRDAEIERTLKLIMQPVQKAAGVGGRKVDIFLVNDRRLNAFVAGGNNIFINTGLLAKMKRQDMLQAVLAHEIAHLTQGHRAQRAAELASARTAAGIGMVVGVAAAAAGGGAGVAAGVQESLRRSLFAFSRAQEAAADQASARYMRAAGINPQAAVDVLKIFRGQEALTVGRQDPYVRTHPLTRDRILRMEAEAARFKGPARSDRTANYYYGRLVAKLNGFLGSPSRTLRRLKNSDRGEIATMTRAIAYHRLPKPKRAAAEAARLVSLRPNDPYYHELRGQILLESGDARGAVASFRRAARLAPKEPLILAWLGQALLANGSGGSVSEALRVLKSAYGRDPRDPRLLRTLAVAYARSNNPGQASVVTAERYALQGNFRQAEIHATRAQRLLPRGTSGWLKAGDVLGVARKVNARKKR